MSSLKIQLGLTLTILLSLAMFLFGLVLLMLWQRSAIKQEIMATEYFMEFAADSIKSNQDEPVLSTGLSHFWKTNNVHCLQWNSTGTSATQSLGNCPDKISLTPLLNNAKSNSNTTSFTGMHWNGFFFSREYLIMAIPVQQPDNDIIAIGVIRSLEQIYNPIKNIQKIFYAYLAINLLIFVTIGFTRLIHLVIRPIQHLAQLADSRTTQNDSTLFSEGRWGEFTKLSSSLNRLVLRIDGDKQQLQTTVQSLQEANKELQNNRDEMVRTEKLASIGRLSAGLAHEIGNPLGIIQGYVDLLADDTLDAESRELFSKKAIQELDRINSLIRNLLDLSRAPSTSASSQVNIHTLLQDSIDAIRIRKTSIEINYKTDFTATDYMVRINPDSLRQVFLNGILNAIDAIEEQAENKEGIILLHTANKPDDTIHIRIMDNGAGIDKKDMDSLFDPFFTTKEVGKGTGLGLAVAHNIIKTCGGTLTITSTASKGSTLHISLPLGTNPYRKT